MVERRVGGWKGGRVTERVEGRRVEGERDWEEAK